MSAFMLHQISIVTESAEQPCQQNVKCGDALLWGTGFRVFDATLESSTVASVWASRGFL